MFTEVARLKKVRKKWIALAGAAVFAVVLAGWLVWSNVTVEMTRYSVASSRLPASFDHSRIVVISDLHNAEFGEDNCQLIRLIEQESPDMIAITGDLVDSSKTNMETAESLIHHLTSIAPCYYVTGNHEAWLGEQYQELEKMLLKEAVVILHNTSVPWKKGQDSIQLAGLDDPDFTDRDSSVQQSILETRLHEMDLTDDYCILLSHRPEAFEAYQSEKVDLVLSGHAHGGQFRLPLIGGIIAPNQGWFPKYDAGIYSQQNTTMIVSRGIGNSIIPVRINNRPEIVSVELICEAY